MKTHKNTLEANAAAELLSQKETGSGPHSMRPLDHLAFAILIDSGFDVPASLSALHKLRREFIDWNEIRVARTQEIVRVLGGGENAERVAQRIKEDYNAFFDNKGALNFDFLASGKPAEMRRVLVQLLPHLWKGAVSLLLYEFCPGGAIPLSDEGLKRAKKDGIVGKNGDRNQLAKILAECLEPHQICILLQYWELEAHGAPYGENGRRDNGNGKKAKKTPAKDKAKSQSE